MDEELEGHQSNEFDKYSSRRPLVLLSRSWIFEQLMQKNTWILPGSICSLQERSTLRLFPISKPAPYRYIDSSRLWHWNTCERRKWPLPSVRQCSTSHRTNILAHESPWARLLHRANRAFSNVPIFITNLISNLVSFLFPFLLPVVLTIQNWPAHSSKQEIYQSFLIVPLRLRQTETAAKSPNHGAQCYGPTEVFLWTSSSTLPDLVLASATWLVRLMYRWAVISSIVTPPPPYHTPSHINSPLCHNNTNSKLQTHITMPSTC